MKYRIHALAIALAAALLVPVLAAPSQAAPSSSQVRIVHGLPLDSAGTLVDVYLEAQGAPISGPPELSSFAFGAVAGPLNIPAGDYTVYVTIAGSPGTVAIDQDLSVPGGLNLDAVASFVPDGSGWAPGINVFVNDVSASSSDGRVSVRHAAAFGAVDINVFSRDGSIGPIPVTGLANGSAADVDAPRTKYRAFLAPAGGDVIVGTGVQVQRDKLTRVYAVGDPAAGTFQFLELRLGLDPAVAPD